MCTLTFIHPIGSHCNQSRPIGIKVPQTIIVILCYRRKALKFCLVFAVQNIFMFLYADSTSLHAIISRHNCVMNYSTCQIFNFSYLIFSECRLVAETSYNTGNKLHIDIVQSSSNKLKCFYECGAADNTISYWLKITGRNLLGLEART